MPRRHSIRVPTPALPPAPILGGVPVLAVIPVVVMATVMVPSPSVHPWSPEALVDVSSATAIVKGSLLHVAHH